MGRRKSASTMIVADADARQAAAVSQSAGAVTRRSTRGGTDSTPVSARASARKAGSDANKTTPKTARKSKQAKSVSISDNAVDRVIVEASNADAGDSNDGGSSSVQQMQNSETIENANPNASELSYTVVSPVVEHKEIRVKLGDGKYASRWVPRTAIISPNALSLTTTVQAVLSPENLSVSGARKQAGVTDCEISNGQARNGQNLNRR